MEPYILIGAIALLGSLLTFFSGFGLGTLLLPVFLIFFPVEMAVTMTALVHFLNNLFKGTLVWRNIPAKIVLKFGLGIIPGTLLGSFCMLYFFNLNPLGSYTLAGKIFFVDPLKLVIAILMLIFAMEELLGPWNFNFSSSKLFAGGVLSGFFGGLSGHQGALRSMFLLKAGLNRDSYIACGTAIALITDLTRIPVYLSNHSLALQGHKWLLLVAILCAFIGAWSGNRMLKKMTFKSMRIIVGVFLVLMSFALGLGLV